VIKVREYKVGQRGPSGSTVQLPPEWVRDLGINYGDIVQLYRDKHDRLIIVPPSHNTAPAVAARKKGVRA